MRDRLEQEMRGAYELLEGAQRFMRLLEARGLVSLGVRESDTALGKWLIRNAAFASSSEPTDA